MNRIIRNALLALATQAAALFALPYHLGVPLTYQVTRGSGTERALVVHLPIDSVFHKRDTVWDTASDGATLTRRIRPDRTLWTIAIRDSLVSGQRQQLDPSNGLPFLSLNGDSLRLDTAVLSIQDSTKTWTQPSCLAPMDLETWSTNKISIAPDPTDPNKIWSWGHLAVYCNRGTGIFDVKMVSGEYFRTLHKGPFGKFSNPVLYTYPEPSGIWSSDSGWIFLEDSATGERWTLEKLGGTKLTKACRWRTKPKAGDQWVWRKIDSTFEVETPSMIDRITLDTSWIRWNLDARLADSGTFQRWTSTLQRDGLEPVSLAVSIDTMGQPPEEHLADSMTKSITSSFTRNWYANDSIFSNLLQLPAPYLDPSKGPGNFHTLAKTAKYSQGHGLVEYQETEVIKYWATISWVFPTVHSTRYTLISHNGVELEHTGIRQRMPLPQPVALRGLFDLESLLAKGGTLLRLTDSRGRILATNSRVLPQALKGGHGMFFVLAKSASGAMGEARFVLP